MELISRMMDGSISYHPEDRLESVLSGPGAKQEEKIARLKEVSLFEACSRRQVRSVVRIARVFDMTAGTLLPHEVSAEGHVLAAYFDLREAPFPLAFDPANLYKSAPHREALAHLLYGISAGGGRSGALGHAQLGVRGTSGVADVTGMISYGGEHVR